MKMLDYHPDRYKIPMPKTPITSTKASSSPPPRMQSQSKEYRNKNTKYANQNIKYTNQNTKDGGIQKNYKYEVWIQPGGQLPLVHESIDPCSHWCKPNRQNKKFASKWPNFPKSLLVLDRSREKHSLPLHIFITENLCCKSNS